MVSRQEQRIFDALQKHCPYLKLTQSYRPDCLTNPYTGKKMEIDIYSELFDIGFEYQGEFHFNKIEGQFNDPDKSRKKDTLKVEITFLIRRVCIVELFEVDLKGAIIDNIKQRVLNTSDFYYTFNKLKAHRLRLFYAYLDYFYQFENVKTQSCKRLTQVVNGLYVKNNYDFKALFDFPEGIEISTQMRDKAKIRRFSTT